MMLPESCSIAHVFSHAGLGDGVRFMKKNSPCAPCGYRFITMARALMWGSSAGETAA